jgi:hypothetical protein
MKKINNYKQLIKEVDILLDMIELSGDKIIGQCFHNAVSSFFYFKNRFNNKIWIKSGIINLGYKYKGEETPLAHAWNMIEIENNFYLLDITIRNLERKGLVQKVEYEDNVDGYIIEHNIKNEDMNMFLKTGKSFKFEGEKIFCDTLKQKEYINEYFINYAKNGF